MASISFRGEKLIGKSNYIEWLSNAKLFLEINGFMAYIDGTENKPIKSLYYDEDGDAKSDELAVKYYEKSSEFERNNKKALGAIKSIISIENIERFKDKATASELWEAIISTYGDSSLELLGRYFNKLILADYSSFKNIDEYTSQIQSASIYLKELGYELPKPYIIWLLFKGLPSSFDSFASRKFEEIAKDLTKINISKLVSELISEEARLSSSIDLEANKATKNNKKLPYCTHCNKKGHLDNKCFLKYPELRQKGKSKNRNPNKNSKEDSNNNKDIKNESPKLLMTAFNEELLELSNYIDTSDNTYNKLVLDSGASEHFTPNKAWLIDFQEVNDKYIQVANGQRVPIKGKGNIPVIAEGQELLIQEVNYVPGLKTTLISSRILASKGWSILFKDHKAILELTKSKFQIEAIWKGNAYFLNMLIDYKTLEPMVYKANTIKNDLDLYHKRFNHLSKDYLLKTISNTEGINNIQGELANCDSCQYGKFHEIVSYSPLKPPIDKLTFYDIDIAGPFRTIGLKGERYFITFTDRFSRAVWAYPIKFKSMAIDIFIGFYNKILNNFNIGIRGLRIDNATEFKSTKWDTFCKDKGIICEYTSRYTPAQNGIAERLNRYIIERLISITKERNIPLFLWPHLIQSIVHIKNRTYNSIIKKTPYEAITNKKPDISYIRVLGSLAYCLKPKAYRKGKLDEKAYKGILVGYESSNNFLIYVPSINQVVNTRDVVIKEDLVYKDDDIIENNYSSLLDHSSPDYDIIKPITNTDNDDDKDNNHNDHQDHNQEIRVIVPTPTDPDQYQRFDNRQSRRLQGLEPENKGLSLYSLAFQAYLSSINKGENVESSNNENTKITLNKEDKVFIELKKPIEPTSYIEAINNPYKGYWQKAMQKEIDSLESNKTWELVPPKPNIKPLKTKWVYKVKDSNENLEFKARFVAKGFEQLYGLDYINTFAAVIKQMSWKLIFALAILYNWYIYKIDMISAFTQGDIDTYIYLYQPEGFINNQFPDYILRLNKALYGLKQSARIWYHTLKKVLEKLGFVVLKADTCIFINKAKNIIICIYVDDLAILSPSANDIEAFINEIQRFFKIKNLGPIKEYLGIEITRTKDSLLLNQTKYIDKLLDKYNMSNCNPLSVPLSSKERIEANKGQANKEDINWFQGLIGSLLFLTLATRVDLTYSVIKLSRFASNPSPQHIALGKKILRYLKGSKELGITYQANTDLYIKGYCDSDYAGDIPTAKSTSGYIFFLANGPISWKSKLQTIIAQSTTEAEYIAINIATKEAIYLKALLEELGLYKQNKFPLYTDNNGALLLANNPIFHERTKHIAVKYHYIRDLIDKGIIDLIYIPTKEQRADGLTKPLDKNLFREFVKTCLNN
jgi:hypothetical protein